MIDSTRTTQHRERYVPAWGPEQFIVPLLDGRIRELFSRYGSRPASAARALDVGCGAQPFRSMIESTGYSYASVDVVQNANGNVDFIGAIDEPLPVALASEAPYDFLLCTEVLEHVVDWPMAFANLTRLLAPDGRLLATCPHFYPLHEVPYDFWRPTPFALRHFAAKNDLEVEVLEQGGGPWEVLGTLLGEAHAYPSTRRFSDRCLAWLGRQARRALLRVLQSGWLPSRVELRGPYYLSNVAVFRKRVK